MGKHDKIEKAIREMKIREGFLYERTPCSKEENKTYMKLLANGEPLPKNVFPYTYFESDVETGDFYLLDEPQFTHEEIMEYLALKTAHDVKKIKHIAIAILLLLCISTALFILSIW